MKPFQIVIVVCSIVGLAWCLGLCCYAIVTKDFYQISGGAFFVSAFIALYSAVVLAAGKRRSRLLFTAMPVIGIALAAGVIAWSLAVQRDYDTVAGQFAVGHSVECAVALGASTAYAAAFQAAALAKALKMKFA